MNYDALTIYLICVVHLSDEHIDMRPKLNQKLNSTIIFSLNFQECILHGARSLEQTQHSDVYVLCIAYMV